MADKLFMYSWYHGGLGRAASESILQSQRPGLFLVRDSQSLQGGYVLSVSENRKVSHYIITQRSGQYQIGDQTFNDLPEIVDFYRRHFLDTTTLVEAAARQTAAPEEEAPAAAPLPSQQQPAAPVAAQPAEVVKVKAKYNFPGNDPDDLPFKKNDILTILKKEEEQWWMARDCMGKEGMIPVNYVDPVPNRGSYNNTSRSSRTAAGMAADVSSVSAPKTSYVAPTTEVTVPAIAEAIQDRHPTVYDPSELRFMKGDKILVLSMLDSGSWEGQLSDGRKGIFPFRYVKMVTSDPQQVEQFQNMTAS